MKRAGLAALILLALAPYARALGSPLLYDDRTLLDNPWLAKEAGPVSVFGHEFRYGTSDIASSGLYRPLTVLSLAWNMRYAPSRAGVRIVNLLAHASAVLALWLVLSRIVGASAAWIGSALFAVHPLGSEAVLWAVGRAEILAALFGLVSFGLFVTFWGDPGARAGRILASASAFLAALFFKESAASWLLIGAAWALLRPKDERPPMRTALLGSSVYLGAFGLYLAARASAIGWSGTPVPFVDNPLGAADAPTRIANAVLLFGRYLTKMVWPARLSVDYGFDQISVVPLFPWGAASALVLSAALSGAVWLLARRGRREIAFLVAFVPCAFAVTANVFFPIGTIFAERLAYAPLMGFCALAGWAIAQVASIAPRGVIVAGLVVALGARGLVRSGDYRDLVTLTEVTAASSPRAVKALVNAGRTRMRTGDPAGARPLLERAVAIWPDYARAWELLAQACDAEGDRACATSARDRAAAAAGRAPSAAEPL